MEPGSPAMVATGEARHDTIQGGPWIVGDYQQDQCLADGTFVLQWLTHWVTGWDPEAREYRAMVADNYGHLECLSGFIDRNLLMFETIGNPPVRLRLIKRLVDDDTIAWRNEMAVGRGPFEPVEHYVCHTIR